MRIWIVWLCLPWSRLLETDLVGSIADVADNKSVLLMRVWRKQASPELVRSIERLKILLDFQLVNKAFATIVVEAFASREHTVDECWGKRTRESFLTPVFDYNFGPSMSRKQYIISAVNDTKSNSAVLLLTGIPGLEDVHLWISMSFCLMYVVSIVGNSVILFIIKTDPNLHEPMYIFLSLLAMRDLGLLVSTMPTILGIFLYKSKEISFNACFAQLFFIHSLSCIESSMLLLMAFDRFVAICNPLRYASILTPTPKIAKMGLVCMLRAVALIFPLPSLLKQFQYCQANVLSHSFCVHQEVMKLACSDITVNRIYGLSIALLTVGLDSLLICLSYVMILRTVLSITSHMESLRALNTCVAHLCAVLLFHTPRLGLPVIHRFGNSSSRWLQIFLGYVYLLVPPLMNPIVYSVKSKHLRVRIIRVFFK
ncbi:olfactory receptor 51G2-like [Chelonoidis abingdonii]|uniref:olfactory receptor 51G2-like n=1 Tax=Chelonoidis abingdonii TaxID=106734 RepID=UPI0013F1D6DB|nr:olfactory receptor 51G2-like [Chelonoidis abingdonii]